MRAGAQQRQQTVCLSRLALAGARAGGAKRQRDQVAEKQWRKQVKELLGQVVPQKRAVREQHQNARPQRASEEVEVESSACE